MVDKLMKKIWWMTKRLDSCRCTYDVKQFTPAVAKVLCRRFMYTCPSQKYYHDWQFQSLKHWLLSRAKWRPRRASAEGRLAVHNEKLADLQRLCDEQVGKKRTNESHVSAEEDEPRLDIDQWIWQVNVLGGQRMRQTSVIRKSVKLYSHCSPLYVLVIVADERSLATRIKWAMKLPCYCLHKLLRKKRRKL